LCLYCCVFVFRINYPNLVLEETSLELKDPTAMVQVDLDELKKNCFGSKRFDVNFARVQDNTLLQKLRHSLDHLDLDSLFGEQLQVSLNELNGSKGERGQGEEIADKFKNSNVINTRTGLKYKAPMRGGHTNTGKDTDLLPEMCNRISLDYDYVIDYAIDCQL